MTFLPLFTKTFFATNATSITTFIISQIVVIFGIFLVQIQNFFLQKDTEKRILQLTIHVM